MQNIHELRKVGLFFSAFSLKKSQKIRLFSWLNPKEIS
jgi:hypothetical protein